MKNLIPLIIFIVIGCSSPSENTEAPFILTTLDKQEIHIEEEGKALHFREFSNQPTLLVLFGHDCPPCLHEIPALVQFKKAHQDINLMAIEVQNMDKKALKSFAKDKDINYSLLRREENSGFLKYIANKASWNGAIPFMIAFDKKGRIYDTHLGIAEKNELEKLYQNLK